MILLLLRLLVLVLLLICVRFLVPVLLIVLVFDTCASTNRREGGGRSRSHYSTSRTQDTPFSRLSRASANVGMTTSARRGWRLLLCYHLPLLLLILLRLVLALLLLFVLLVLRATAS